MIFHFSLGDGKKIYKIIKSENLYQYSMSEKFLCNIKQAQLPRKKV